MIVHHLSSIFTDQQPLETQSFVSNKLNVYQLINVKSKTLFFIEGTVGHES